LPLQPATREFDHACGNPLDPGRGNPPTVTGVMRHLPATAGLMMLPKLSNETLAPAMATSALTRYSPERMATEACPTCSRFPMAYRPRHRKAPFDPGPNSMPGSNRRSRFCQNPYPSARLLQSIVDVGDLFIARSAEFDHIHNRFDVTLKSVRLPPSL
jgi:hypothetical protein